MIYKMKLISGSSSINLYIVSQAIPPLHPELPYNAAAADLRPCGCSCSGGLRVLRVTLQPSTSFGVS